MMKPGTPVRLTRDVDLKPPVHWSVMTKNPIIPKGEVGIIVDRRRRGRNHVTKAYQVKFLTTGPWWIKAGCLRRAQ